VHNPAQYCRQHFVPNDEATPQFGDPRLFSRNQIRSSVQRQPKAEPGPVVSRPAPYRSTEARSGAERNRPVRERGLSPLGIP